MLRYIILVLCSLALLLASSVVHATEPQPDTADDETLEAEDEDGEDEAVQADEDDPVRAALKSQVKRYYRDLGLEATEEQLRSGLEASFDMVLAGVSIAQIGAAVDKAIALHEPGQALPFRMVVPRYVQQAPEGATATVAGPPAEPEIALQQSDVNSALVRSYSDRRRGAIKSIVFGGVSLFFGAPGLLGGSVALVVLAADRAPLNDPFVAILFSALVAATIIGAALTIVGVLLVAVGVKSLNRAETARRLRQHPERRHTLARRAQVEWGLRFGVL